MAIPEPSCCDGPNELLRKILLGLPDISGGGGSGNVQSGSQAIGSGVDTISVVFPVAYSGVPDVVISISRPVAENLIQANIDEASITTTGFTASLSATTGTANYRIKWMANE